jgi:dATP pyrophosphohydrolase
VLVYLFRRTGDGSLEWLMLLRTPQGGAFWQGVSGAPEWGEPDRDAAVREVREETGFETAHCLLPIDFRYELRRPAADADWERLYGPGVDSVPEEVYVAEVPHGRDPTLDPVEHVAWRWCAVGAASDLLVWEENRRALDAARAFVTKP